jgi:uncharacterized protein YaaQ
MKLIYAIIHERDSDLVVEALIKHGFTVTRMASTGGFLRFGNVTLLIAVDSEKVDEVINLLKTLCLPSEPAQSAATIFVIEMPIFRKLPKNP